MGLSRVPSLVYPPVTVAVGAYSTGFCVGGVLSLAGALQKTACLGWLMSLLVTDQAGARAPLTVLLFSAQPSGGTYTDYAALVLSAADLAVFLGAVNVLASDYTTVGTGAVAAKYNLQLPVQVSAPGGPSAAGTLYALVMTTGTPTYGAAGALGLGFGFDQL